MKEDRLILDASEITKSSTTEDPKKSQDWRKYRFIALALAIGGGISA